MKVDAFNRQMRVFETAHDHRVPLGIYMVVRIDGRGFSRSTKEVHKFEPPLMLDFATIWSRPPRTS